MLAPAFCGGEVECLGGRLDLLERLCEKLDEAGIEVTETDKGLKVKRRTDEIKAMNVTTEPFPGFPTDLQAQMMAVLCTANGTSVLEEKIFENRFMHAPELDAHGGQHRSCWRHGDCNGCEQAQRRASHGDGPCAPRSLILAGLAAEGETKVSRVYHLDRGYEQVVRKLQGVGAQIERMSE